MLPLLASDYDKSKYLRGGDIKAPTKFRIKAVTPEELKDRNGKTGKKLILSFTTIEQELILNKTNLRALQGAFGDSVTDWVGKVIIIFPTMTDMGPGLRVRIPPPKQAAPQQPAAPRQPVTSGNGAATPAAAPVAAPPAAAAPLAAAAPAVVDPELEPDPVVPIGDDLDDEIDY